MHTLRLTAYPWFCSDLQYTAITIQAIDGYRNGFYRNANLKVFLHPCVGWRKCCSPWSYFWKWDLKIKNNKHKMFPPSPVLFSPFLCYLGWCLPGFRKSSSAQYWDCLSENHAEHAVARSKDHRGCWNYKLSSRKCELQRWKNISGYWLLHWLCNKDEGIAVNDIWLLRGVIWLNKALFVIFQV